MKITLKNGRNIELHCNPIILEYLCDYPGGIEELKKDQQNGENTMYIANHIAYSVLSANLDEELTYKQILSLIKTEDIEKIIDFFNDNMFDKEENFKSQEKLNRKKH